PTASAARRSARGAVATRPERGRSSPCSKRRPGAIRGSPSAATRRSWTQGRRGRSSSSPPTRRRWAKPPPGGRGRARRGSEGEMKVIVISDMEGVSGVVKWEQVDGGEPLYEEARKLY